jgi:hypothetical protein
VLVVITLDYDDRNPLILQEAQHSHSMICRLRLHVPPVEEITGYHDEIYAARYRISLDYLSPCSEEIGGPVGEVIPFDAEMNISYVKKPCHINNQISRGPYGNTLAI